MTKRKRYDDLLLLAPGEIVPGHRERFTVERVVGTGAFAAVYLARDPEAPGRQIALKEFFSARHPREQASLKALFDRERYVGQQASSHPLMPSFYEAFAHDGYFYIAQEFIGGETLDEIIFKRHPLPREWTLKWAVSLCDALAFLHSRHIVHHDLKPANIRITPQGHLTLLDFGAAQYFGDGHDKTPPLELYGTEGYLPPELEADGQWVADVRTDIFALGCILYELVAGIAPDQDEINARSMYVTNSLLQRPNADFNLVKLINQAVSYNTDFRYASANAFLLELRKIAPPVLLVSHKHLRFGEVSAGQTVPPRTVTLYNAGGGETRGEIKPRAPWISVPTNGFKGNKRNVAVQVDTSKIAERGTLVVGRLEINMADERDAAGDVLHSGDRWFIECSISVAVRPGVLRVRERPTADAPPIEIGGRKGQAAEGAFTLVNDGETDVEFRIQRPADEITSATIAPDTGMLMPGESQTVTVRVPTMTQAAGVQNTTLLIRTTASQTLAVPLAIRTLSPLEFLKKQISRR